MKRDDCLTDTDRALEIARLVDAERISLAAAAMQLLRGLKGNESAQAVGLEEIRIAEAEIELVKTACAHALTRHEFQRAANPLFTRSTALAIAAVEMPK